jgi:hypothetical protein
MAEYGHFGRVVAGCAIDAWGAGPFILRDKGKEWSFEFSDRFGPILLNKDGEPRALQPISPKHPFWRPFNAWLAQGKKVEDGVAVWREPLPTVLRHIVGRHYAVEEKGEDGGQTIVLPSAGKEGE